VLQLVSLCGSCGCAEQQVAGTESAGGSTGGVVGDLLIWTDAG